MNMHHIPLYTLCTRIIITVFCRSSLYDIEFYSRGVGRDYWLSTEFWRKQQIKLNIAVDYYRSIFCLSIRGANRAAILEITFQKYRFNNNSYCSRRSELTVPQYGGFIERNFITKQLLFWDQNLSSETYFLLVEGGKFFCRNDNLTYSQVRKVGNKFYLGDYSRCIPVIKFPISLTPNSDAGFGASFTPHIEEATQISADQNFLFGCLGLNNFLTILLY